MKIIDILILLLIIFNIANGTPKLTSEIDNSRHLKKICEVEKAEDDSVIQEKIDYCNDAVYIGSWIRGD
uniref:Uncharacterized protein n=1 Tax=Meloidogyne enterolobii TaxID=390850 RepID=A0A6V7WI63_MELEN|nr:unnamed protein product [Meloidogyne enterolobii]